MFFEKRALQKSKRVLLKKMSDTSQLSVTPSPPENADGREGLHNRRRRWHRHQRNNLDVDLSDSSLDRDSSDSNPPEGDEENSLDGNGDYIQEGNSGDSEAEEDVEMHEEIHVGAGEHVGEVFVPQPAAADIDESDREVSDESEPEQDDDESVESDDSAGHEDVNDDTRLFDGSPLSLTEFMLMLLTFFLRHKLTGICLGDLLNLICMLCPPGNHCVNTLYKFKKYFSMIGESIVKSHYFCAGCEGPLETENDICDNCEPGQKVNYFFEVPLLKQLQSLLLRPGFYESLLFRFQRVKKFEGNIEDVYDGQIYRKQMQNGFLDNQNHISFMWYSDGIAIFKSSNFSVWPMYLVIVELEYKMGTQRQNIILAGIWLGDKKPNPNLFLQPLNRDLDNLKNNGCMFEVPNHDPVLIRGKLLCGVGDLQAKCRFMRMKQWNGYFGCLLCMITGARFDIGDGKSVHVYPYSRNVDLRNNAHIPGYAAQAVRNRRYDPDADVYGVKGPSLLFLLLPNVIKCMGIDAMHGVFIGVMKLLTQLWFDSSFSGMRFSVYHLVDVVDQRLKNLRPPSNTQKMPKSIQTKLKFWKALDYKLWCFYYSLPVLLDILPEIYWRHHCKLVSAVAILHQESISNEQLDVASDLIHSYLADFEQLYGLRHMTMNVHQLIHLPDVVRNLGPLWVYNCFFFEDLNGCIARLVHGTRHAAMQISSSVSAVLTLPEKLNELDPNNPVRLFCDRMLTSGQAHVKITYIINPNLGVAGKFTDCNPIPELVRNALSADVNILNGRCKYFYKLKKKSFVYVAVIIPKICKNYQVTLSSGRGLFPICVKLTAL